MTESKPLAWKTREGFIPLSDMKDEHIQAALITAEHSYMNYNNRAVEFSIDAENYELQAEKENSNKAIRLALYAKRLERKAVWQAETAKVFYELIKGFYAEAKTRGIELVSLADRDAGKFSILRTIPR